MFSPIKPMLATTHPEPFNSRRHIFEVKWDGYRAIAHVRDGSVHLQSRNLHDMTASFPSLSSISKCIKAPQAVLDGEIIAVDGGKPNFSSLRSGKAPVVYVVFDLLYHNGVSTMQYPLMERRRRLEACVEQDTSYPVAISFFMVEEGKRFFDTIRDQGLEGMIAKEIDSRYLPGIRTRAWLKIKNVKTLDCTIIGYVAHGGRIRSLLLGLREEGTMKYVGSVGSGISEGDSTELLRLLRPAPAPPFDMNPRNTVHPRSIVQGQHGLTWCHPCVTCEVAYTEFTPDMRLRHPVYRGLKGGCPG